MDPGMQEARSLNFRVKRDGKLSILNLQAANTELATIGLGSLDTVNGDETRSAAFPQGGEVWSLAIGKNGDGTNTQTPVPPVTNQWKQKMTEQLLSMLAGPSGTTDECLQGIEYTSLMLTGLGAYAARSFPGATMIPYCHHSYAEVMQGARGKERFGMNVFNEDKPFEDVFLIPPGPVLGKTAVALSPNNPPVFTPTKTAKINAAPADTAGQFIDAVVNRMAVIKANVPALQGVLRYIPALGGLQAAQSYAAEGKPSVDMTAIAPAVPKADILKHICNNPAFNAEPAARAVLWPECGKQAEYKKFAASEVTRRYKNPTPQEAALMSRAKQLYGGTGQFRSSRHSSKLTSRIISILQA